MILTCFCLSVVHCVMLRYCIMLRPIPICHSTRSFVFYFPELSHIASRLAFNKRGCFLQHKANEHSTP